MNAREAFNQILETIDDAATWLHKNAVDFVEENDLQPRYDIVYAALDRLEAIEKRAKETLSADYHNKRYSGEVVNYILNGEGEAK